MKRVLFMVMAVALNFSMSSCASAGGFSNEKIRYKMTVTVETPEGVKTGYAVREASRYTEPSILPDQGGTFYNITKGEAVVVDLGQRGVLFVLMGRQSEARAIFKARSEEKTEVTDLIASRYPMLVFFKNLHDPKTVYEVSADTNLARGRYRTKLISLKEAFGEGVSIYSISIENNVDAQPDNKIIQYLPWLADIKGYIDGSFAGGGPELSNILDKGDFIKG